MKRRRDATADVRVPLSTEAQAVFGAARRDPVPERPQGGAVGRDSGAADGAGGMAARPNGFRFGQRDWIAGTMTTPHEVAGTCLGHSVGGSVERAYRRTDYLEQRRGLMEAWAGFVAGGAGSKTIGTDVVTKA